jgi:hypothetical protein
MAWHSHKAIVPSGDFVSRRQDDFEGTTTGVGFGFCIGERGVAELIAIDYFSEINIGTPETFRT